MRVGAMRHPRVLPARPPTKVTRRKQLDLDVKLPMATFLDLMRPLDTGDAKWFEWVDDAKMALVPT